VNTEAADAELVLGGRYRLITPVGTGGMAVVWQARDEVLGRTVAVKVLTAEYAGDQESRDRIRHEARAAAALSHPNIAQVYDYGEGGVAGEVFPYVVMELVPGGTLLDRLAAGPVAAKYAMRVCSEIAAALAAAHTEGLVHRDVKLANVMLAPTGAKVVDFGIAAVTAPSGSGGLDSMVFGTPAYLAPERLIDDAVEPASDVYALGVVLYRLLAGHSPWTTESTTQMLTAHIYIDPAPLPPTNGVPEYIRELCDRCLAKDPSMRPSAREAAALLARGAGMRDVADEPPAAAPELAAVAASGLAAAAAAATAPADADADAEPERSPRRKPARRWAVAAALLVVAGALAWPLFPDTTKDDREPPAAGGVSSAPSLPAAPGSVPPAASRGATPSGLAPTRSGGGQVVVPTLPTRTPTVPPTATRTPAPTDPTPGTTTDDNPAEPEERVLTSTGGSVRATCPEPGTAQIRSATPADKYKIQASDLGPGAAPSVTFKHGNRVVTMTVTCSASVPSATVT
jgi:tRNA A-37 threonylcarbamoyl transferase component Bud32